MNLTSNFVETSTVFMEIRNNILYIIVKEDADIDLEAVKEAFEQRKKLQGNEPILVLVDNRKLWQLTKDANRYSASKEVADLSKAMAVLTDTSLATRMITNFFVRLNKEYTPTKLFKNEKKALKWLNSFKS